MKNLDLKELNGQELDEVNGGGWFIPFLVGYVAGEILEGIQNGIDAECTPQTCC